MQIRAESVRHEATVEVDRFSRLSAAIIAALLGAFILLGAGFAHPEALHNAAHDARHAFAFPCH